MKNNMIYNINDPGTMLSFLHVFDIRSRVVDYLCYVDACAFAEVCGDPEVDVLRYFRMALESIGMDFPSSLEKGDEVIFGGTFMDKVMDSVVPGDLIYMGQCELWSSHPMTGRRAVRMEYHSSTFMVGYKYANGSFMWGGCFGPHYVVTGLEWRFGCTVTLDITRSDSFGFVP